MLTISYISFTMIAGNTFACYYSVKSKSITMIGTSNAKTITKSYG